MKTTRCRVYRVGLSFIQPEYFIDVVTGLPYTLCRHYISATLTGRNAGREYCSEVCSLVHTPYCIVLQVGPEQCITNRERERDGPVDTVRHRVKSDNFTCNRTVSRENNRFPHAREFKYLFTK